MCSVQYVVCNVQFVVYSVQCAVCSVRYVVCSVQCVVYSVQCVVYSVQCTVYQLAHSSSHSKRSALETRPVSADVKLSQHSYIQTVMRKYRRPGYTGLDIVNKLVLLGLPELLS